MVWKTLGGTARVAHICPCAGWIGIRNPTISPIRADHAPAAMISVWQRISPPVVDAAQPPPDAGAMETTARLVKIRAPSRSAADANARVDFTGSACARSGVNMQPGRFGFISGSIARAWRAVIISALKPRPRISTTRSRM